MPRGNHNPNNLPTKTCAACGRVFAWRKKWQRDWENVRYCSKACARQAKTAPDHPKSPGAGRSA